VLKRSNLIHLGAHPFVLLTRLVRVFSYLAWPVLAPLAKIRRWQIRDSTSLVAVVGSFGKTTTTRAVGVALNCSTVSGRNSWSYLALGILQLERNQKFAALEAAIARRGQMRRYARLIKPDITVVTSVGSEHLLSMKSLEGIRREKSEMVAAVEFGGVVILNGDDPNVLWMKNRAVAEVVTYGFGEQNSVRASDCRINWPSGTQFRVHTATGIWEVQLGLIGNTMVYPALAAIAVGMSKGIQMETILTRLKELKPAPGRLEPMRLSSGAWALRDDHKSGIETIHAAVSTLRQIEAPRRIAVLGDITEEIGSVRPVYRELGAELGEVVDLLMLTGRYARSIGVGARMAGMPSESVIDCHKDIFKASEILGAYLQEGDVVLLKGRFEQRLRRVALMLAGETVNCRLKTCTVKGLHCESCAARVKGWPANVTGI